MSCSAVRGVGVAMDDGGVGGASVALGDIAL